MSKRLKLSEFIAHVRKEVGDELVKSTCPDCYGKGAIRNSHKCDWKSFYLAFRDKPDYLIASMRHNRTLFPIITIGTTPSEG